MNDTVYRASVALAFSYMFPIMSDRKTLERIRDEHAAAKEPTIRDKARLTTAEYLLDCFAKGKGPDFEGLLSYAHSKERKAS